METATLWDDPWETSAREKARRAAWENTPDGALRREAQNPDTTGPRLREIAEPVIKRKSYVGDNSVEQWVLEAVASHPNVPLGVAYQLLATRTDALVRAFFANPIAPLVLLEKPDFITSFSPLMQPRLLAQEQMPAVFVQQLTRSPNEAVGEAARLHIAFAGEAGANEWQDAVRDYFRAFCARADPKMRQWHADLVELGLAPSWAADPLPPLLLAPRKAVLDEWYTFRHAPQSEREETLCRRIARSAEPPFVAHALRPDATPDDLLALVTQTGLQTKLTGLAVLRHSAATPDLIRTVLEMDAAYFSPAAACHPLMPAEVIAGFLHSPVPEIRRTARAHPNAPEGAVAASLRPVLKLANDKTHRPEGAFVSLIQALHRHGRGRFLDAQTNASEWTKRLEAVLMIPTSEIKTPVTAFREGRTMRDALLHLSHDGNRIVRAAAKTRLANPDYLFVL